MNKSIPKNTILAVPNQIESDTSRVYDIILKNDKKRDWFPKEAYRCLPLTIGNQYGFSVISEYDFSFVWDGSESPEGIKFNFFENIEILKNKLPAISSHFGSGIITVNLPFHFRTPDGVNLMTINPPNHIIQNITVLTGVIESDNLRRDFSFNLKVQIPNIEVTVRKGTPLAGFIPIPRYYVDSFKIVDSKDVLEEEDILAEIQHNAQYKENRRTLGQTGSPYDKLYLNGLDAFGNKFKDHQKSIK